MVQTLRLYGESSSFSGEAQKYGYDAVDHRILKLDDPRSKIEWLRGEIARQVGELTENEVLAIAFAGFPGVEKTSQLRHMISIVAKALGWGSSPLLSFHHPIPWVDPTLTGRIARDGDVWVVHGDHMFWAIGSDRRGVLLSNMANFQKYWWDDARLARIFWDIVRWVSPTDRIYRGTSEEKEQKNHSERLSFIRVFRLVQKKWWSSREFRV